MTDSTSTTINDLKPKQQLTGTIKKVELFGALVDVGAERDGLVHISQLKKGRVNNASDVVEVGQEVTVWVRRIDEKAGRIELTMLEPPAVMWDELQVGQVLGGKVVRLEKFGAFVDIGAERPGLVHISELADGYVKSPSDVVSVGDEVEAQVIGLNRKKGRIDLSMKALSPGTLREEMQEEEEEGLTAFALAYQRALMEEQEVTGEDAVGEHSPEDNERHLQDKLLERTLEQHRNREQ